MRNYIAACVLACGIFAAAAVFIPLSATAADAVVPSVTEEATWYGAIADIPSHEATSISRHMLSVQEEPAYEEPVHEEYYVDYGSYDPDLNNNPAYSGAYRGDGFYSQGVRAGIDSATETWYPRSAGEHYRTGEWHTDDEGYYRDADGYYVVSSDDYTEGDVVNTSKGQAKVYDSGSGAGNIDMYVDW